MQPKTLQKTFEALQLLSSIGCKFYPKPNTYRSKVLTLQERQGSVSIEGMSILREVSSTKHLQSKLYEYADIVTL